MSWVLSGNLLPKLTFPELYSAVPWVCEPDRRGTGRACSGRRGDTETERQIWKRERRRLRQLEPGVKGPQRPPTTQVLLGPQASAARAAHLGWSFRHDAHPVPRLQTLVWGISAWLSCTFPAQAPCEPPGGPQMKTEAALCRRVPKKPGAQGCQDQGQDQAGLPYSQVAWNSSPGPRASPLKWGNDTRWANRRQP